MSKLFKSTLVVMASAVVAAPVAASGDTVKFTDVKESHDYYKDVYTLVERGVISGYADHTFRPNDELTRGQAAKILAIALGLEIAPVKQSSFKDVSDQNQYLPYIEALVKQGIINGYSDGTFKPQNTLTRAQMAKILVKGFELTSEGGSLPFTDVTTKSSYYEDIHTLYSLGITKGNTETTYSPNEAVKRGQMASFVMRSERATLSVSEEVQEVQEEQVTGSIVKINGNYVMFETGSYEIPESLQGLLSEQNNVAIENAVIEATVKGEQLVNIRSLTITAQGTSEAPIILNGVLKAEPVASITPIAGNLVTRFNGILQIESNYIQISNLQVEDELVVSKNVKEITITHPVKQLTILSDAEAVIKGATNIGQITVASEKPVHLDVEGKVSDLHFTVEKAALRLGTGLKVVNIQTLYSGSMEKFISNYGAVKKNIDKVNNEIIKSDVPSVNYIPDYGSYQPTKPDEDNADKNPSKPDDKDDDVEEPSNPDNKDDDVEEPSNPSDKDDDVEEPSNPGDKDGDVEEPSNPDDKDDEPSTPSVSTITGTVEITSDSVLIDGKTYEIADEKISKLLHSSNMALDGATISVVIENLVIIEVTSLTINNSGTIYGGNLVISESVVVNADDVTLNNLTVEKNLTLTQAVATSFTANNLVVNGETVVEEAKTAVRARYAIAALDPSLFMAENSKTTVTITFNDSSVATFVINKENVKMNADGMSTFSSISVLANGAILEAGNVLPEIIVSGNATSVELNATIQNIRIESNENIAIVGDAFVKNLEINSTKEVALNVKGVIENVAVKNNGKVSLGADMKVGNVKSSDNKPVGEIVSNYAEVESQINPENTVNTDITDKPFAADLQSNYKRFGYYTINAAFTKGKQVRYLITSPGEKPTYTIGEKVSEAFVYDGKEFPILINHIHRKPNVVIFLTETDGTILEYNLFEIQDNAAFYLRPVTYEINEDNTMTIKTIFDDSTTPQSILKFVFLFSDNGVVVEETDLSSYEWKKIDGLNTITVPLLKSTNYMQNLELYINNFSSANFPEHSDEMLYTVVKRIYSFIDSNNDFGINSNLKSIMFRLLLQAQGIQNSHRPADAHLLYDLQTGNETLTELKAMAKAINGFKSFEIDKEELGLTPYMFHPVGNYPGYRFLEIENEKVIVNPSLPGKYDFHFYDENNNVIMLRISFEFNENYEIISSHSVHSLIPENRLPFTVAASTDGEERATIQLTFTESIENTEDLIRIENTPIYGILNGDSTVLTIFSVDESFRGKTFTVNYLNELYSFSFTDTFALTPITKIESH